MKEDLTFRKMRRRFSLFAMLLIAVTLGIIVITVGYIVYSRTEREISQAVESSALDQNGAPGPWSPGDGNKPNGVKRNDNNVRTCSYIMVDEDYNVVNSVGEFALYSKNDLKTLIAAFKDVEGSKIRLNGRYYYFKIHDTDDGYTIVAYDYTSDRAMLLLLMLTAALLWLFGSGLSGSVAYLLSAKVVSPAKEALAKQRDLVANASHELKTPITVINADLSILTADPTATIGENEMWISAITDQTKRMQSMVQEMLELSRMDSDKVQADIAPVDFADLVEFAAMTIEGVAFERNITVECNAQRVTIESDRGMLEKVIYILFDNALKYTNDGGKIDISLSADKKYATLSVTNTGKGIPVEKLPYIFDRFYKADESHSGEDHSFGLGLSMAERTVAKLNGSIDCVSNENAPTTFTVKLPRAQKKECFSQIKRMISGLKRG